MRSERWLFYEDYFFINGESIEMQDGWSECLKQLADHSNLPAAMLRLELLEDEAFVSCLYNWYQAGYLDIGAHA